MSLLEDLKDKLRKVMHEEIELKEACLSSEKVTFWHTPDVTMRSLKAEHYRLSTF